MSSFLLIIGLLVFAYACRSFQNRYINKIGWLTLLAATYLGGFFITGSHIGGAAALTLWMLLPWFSIVTQVRKVRYPFHHELKHRFPPSRDIFPDLDAITDEVEATGFEKTDDTGWKWDSADHFVRLFYHAEKKFQANLNVSQQDNYVFSYASLTTRTGDGQCYVTTNNPFVFTMKVVPNHHVNRFEQAESFADLLKAHETFLSSRQIDSDQINSLDPDSLPTTVSREITQQIDHNLNMGVLVKLDEKHFRYTWRGCFFLWFQVMKDMIRV